ncbi:sugar ABC transporter ATP-binding protein [Shinella sp.]|uniref:sugar ABC transporter ATP-binding protein n=1 Tax=Shinella sp. TaxID=1870904 RepID=UPI00258E3F3D|nr:sugar ABC transporter ATP-binding protein [Shinella sp.]MCW5706878.1 sugar ABC transporter ATP-binding protein [Shinella sp.]
MTEASRSANEASAPILTMRGVSKTFGATKALSSVMLDVYPGEIHSLMGENGAGKSTLMKILSGAIHPDPGAEIKIDGRIVAIDGPASAKDLGVAVIYQELVLAPNLSVAENIYLGRELKTGGVIDRGAMQAACEGLLKELGATFGPKDWLGKLTMAEQQMVEIARAIHAKARILIMDEPTTALSTRETDRLFALVRQLRKSGLAIIYISHRMNEIYELSDRCSVLRDGSYVGTLSRDELSAEKLIKMMVGRDLSTFYKKEHVRTATDHDVVLSVKGLGDGSRIHSCSLDVRRGEVVGVAGLVGSGRTELARMIYGLDRRTSGEMTLEGKAFNPSAPTEAIRSGLVYLAEDRKGSGLFLDMSVSENINLNVIDRDARIAGVLDLGAGRKRAADAIKALKVRVSGGNVSVGSLSGGNQQKVLLARLLQTQPKVLILDEPTRGIDIGAKAEIYRIIDELAAGGAAIIMISSELPEIIGTADRVFVMREGTIAGELVGQADEPITQEAIIELATGATTAASLPR